MREYKSIIKREKPLKAQALSALFVFFGLWVIFVSCFLIGIYLGILPESSKESSLFEPYAQEKEFIDNAMLLLFFGVIYFYIAKLLWDLRDTGRILAIVFTLILAINGILGLGVSESMGYETKKIELVPSFHPLIDFIMAVVIIYFLWFDRKLRRRYH